MRRYCLVWGVLERPGLFLLLSLKNKKDQVFNMLIVINALSNKCPFNLIFGQMCHFLLVNFRPQSNYQENKIDQNHLHDNEKSIFMILKNLNYLTFFNDPQASTDNIFQMSSNLLIARTDWKKEMTQLRKINCPDISTTTVFD